MKVFADSNLPLRPERASEKYLLYTFESRGRGLVWNVVAFFAMLGILISSQIWIFGVFAIFALVGIYLSFEARAVCRMIRRVSMHSTEPTESTAQPVSDGNAEDPPGVEPSR